MGLLETLPEILAESKTEYEKRRTELFQTIEEITEENTQGQWRNLLALGDNENFMNFLQRYKNMAGRIQLIYIDPPFFSRANYDAAIRLEKKGDNPAVSLKHPAYEDIWNQDPVRYLKMLAVRLFLMRDLLKEEGTIWVHLDWHASHYVRIFMDEIFGVDRFINEIIWNYKSGGTGKKHFARKHDTILAYSKTKNYYFQPLKEKSYNRDLRPYRFKGVEEFQDEVGWYTLVNMKDVWQIDMVGRTSSERTGYATQKPEALLERILRAGTREGDICADFFCGSGTLAAVAQKLNRRWICCDAGKLAVSYTMKRLLTFQSRPSMEFLRQETFGENHKEMGRLTVKSKKFSQGEGSFLRLEMADYRTIHSDDGAEGEAAKILRRIAEEDPLRLLDCWSIDLSYDGAVYRPEKFFIRNKEGLPLTCERWEKEERPESQKICIKATDVFGNDTYYVIDRRSL